MRTFIWAQSVVTILQCGVLVFIVIRTRALNTETSFIHALMDVLN